MTRAWFVLLLALVALGPHTGTAQTVATRLFAGEHADFTRVVAQSATDMAWALSRDGRQITLTPTAGRAAVSVAGLFDRIPRARLARARVDNGAVVLDLACDCEVTTFTLRAGVFVLDIGAVLLAPPSLQAVEPVAARPAPRRPATPPEVAALAGRTLARDLRPPEPTPGDDPALTHQAAAMGQLMARALADGITRGILDTSGATPAAPAMLLPGADPSTLGEQGFAAIRDPSAPPVPADQSDPQCDMNALIAPLGTPSDMPAARRLAGATAAFYGEFDALSPEALQTSVLTLLSLGLGHEAHLVLSLADPALPTAPILTAIADVIEDLPSNARMTLANSVDCPGALGVFALLAAPPVPRDADWHMQQALSFSQFPAELRFVLAERLFDRHLASGALDAARVVHEAMIRSGFFPVGQLAQFDARLEAARGHADLAMHRLESARWTNARELLSLMALDPGAAADPDGAQSAEAVATAERLTRPGRDLMVQVIQRHAGAGRYIDALASLDRLASWPLLAESDATALTELRGSLWQRAAETLDQAPFLELLLLRPDWRDPSLATTAKQAIDARLAALGVELTAWQPSVDAPSTQDAANAPTTLDETGTTTTLGEDRQTEIPDQIAQDQESPAPPADPTQLADTVRPQADTAPPTESPTQAPSAPEEAPVRAAQSDALPDLDENAGIAALPLPANDISDPVDLMQTGQRALTDSQRLRDNLQRLLDG